MSEIDDKTQAVSEKAVSSTHGQRREDGGSGGIIILFFIVGLVASLVVGWVLFPKLLYSQKKPVS